MDDAVDLRTSEDADTVAAELDRWRAELNRCFGDAAAQTMQGKSLKLAVRRFDLPRKPFDDLIDGVAMDLGVRRYETFEDLYEYCLCVASAVGLICIEIFGYRNANTRDYAIALGRGAGS